MKKSELIDKYSKHLHIKNYFAKMEKSYLHPLNLFVDSISNDLLTNTYQ